MVFPCILTQTAPRVAFPLHGENSAVRTRALEGLFRHHEGDLFAGFPEALSKFMREEQGIVAAFAGERFDGLPTAFPCQAEPHGVPLAEFKPIRARLAEEEFQEFDAGHRETFQTAAGWQTSAHGTGL